MSFLPKCFLFLIGIAFMFSFCTQNDIDNLIVKHELNKGYFLQSTSSNWKSKYYDYLEINKYPSIAVAEKNLFGAIDKNGKTIVPFEYEFVEVYKSVIIAHAFPSKHELYALISFFDHSGKKLFSKLLMNSIPIGDHLIYGSVNQMEGVILSLTGEKLYECAANKNPKEILPNIFEFTSRKGELQYIDNQGKEVKIPEYLPLYLTYKNYEKSEYMAARNQDGTSFLLDKNNEIVSLPDDYIIQDVKYNFAVLKEKGEGRQHVIYDIKNKKILENTISQDFIKIHKCNQEGIAPMIYFNNIYNYIEGKTQFKYVNEFNEIIMTYGEPNPNHRSDDEKYIQNFCNPDSEKYFFKRRISNSNDFICFEGLKGEIYFKHKNTEEVFVKDNLFLEYGSASIDDKYSIVYEFDSEKKTKKYGLVDHNLEKVIPLEYDKISKAGSFNNKFFLHKGGKIGMTDSEANIILEPQFDKIDQMASFYKKSGVLLARDENKYQIFSFAGVPLDDEIYTRKTQEQNYLVVKPIILSNEKTKIEIDAKARINRNSK